MLDEATTMAAIRSERFLRRFWKKVEKSDGCWRWTGAHDVKGYGRIWLVPNVQMIIASRAAWMIAHGYVPSSAFVLHRCDVPACANPAHLFLGDAAANIQDCLSKGRFTPARGEDAGKARLSAYQVAEIRRKSASGRSLRSLAAEFGMGQTTIFQIVHRTIWRHVV